MFVANAIDLKKIAAKVVQISGKDLKSEFSGNEWVRSFWVRYRDVSDKKHGRRKHEAKMVAENVEYLPTPARSPENIWG